jgi:hypothetical protein
MQRQCTVIGTSPMLRMPVLLTDWIPVVEWFDEMYHRGYVPELIGRYVCDRLDEWYLLSE